jgi:hypothetical protein
MLTIGRFFNAVHDQELDKGMITKDLTQKIQEVAKVFKSGISEFYTKRNTMAIKCSEITNMPNWNYGCFALLDLKKKCKKPEEEDFFSLIRPDELPIHYGYKGDIKYFKYFKCNCFIDPYLGRSFKNYDGLFPISHAWAKQICELSEGECVIVNGFKENDKSFVQHTPLPIYPENLLVKIHDAKQFIIKHPKIFRARTNIEKVIISWERPLEISSQVEANLLKAIAVILKDAYEGKAGFVIGKNKMNASAIATRVLKNLPEEYSRQGIKEKTLRDLIPRAMAILEENKKNKEC